MRHSLHQDRWPLFHHLFRFVQGREYLTSKITLFVYYLFIYFSNVSYYVALLLFCPVTLSLTDPTHPTLPPLVICPTSHFSTVNSTLYLLFNDQCTFSPGRREVLYLCRLCFWVPSTRELWNPDSLFFVLPDYISFVVSLSVTSLNSLICPASCMSHLPVSRQWQ